MHCFTPNIRDAFGPVEQALRGAFIMTLFHGLGDGTPGMGVTRLPVKQEGLSLVEPTNTAPEIWTTSCVIIGNIVAALRGQEDFSTSDH